MGAVVGRAGQGCPVRRVGAWVCTRSPGSAWWLPCSPLEASEQGNHRILHILPASMLLCVWTSSHRAASLSPQGTSCPPQPLSCLRLLAHPLPNLSSRGQQKRGNLHLQPLLDTLFLECPTSS